MRVLFQGCALALICACGEVKSPKSDAATDSASGADVNTSDASTARCDPGKPFGTPALLANVNTSNEESTLSLSGDERIAFIGRGVETTSSSTILLAQRASPDLDFPAPASTLTAAVNNE